MAIHEFRAEPQQTARKEVACRLICAELSRSRLRGGQPVVNAATVRDVILTDTSSARTEEVGRASLDRFRLSRMNSGRTSAARVSTGCALLLVQIREWSAGLRATTTPYSFRFGREAVPSCSVACHAVSGSQMKVRGAGEKKHDEA